VYSMKFTASLPTRAQVIEMCQKGRIDMKGNSVKAVQCEVDSVSVKRLV